MKSSFYFLFFIIFLVSSILLTNPVEAQWGYNYQGTGIREITQNQFTGNLTNFTELQDTFTSYSGRAGECLIVNSSETGLNSQDCNSVDSVASGDTLLLISPTTGNVVATINHTILRNVIIGNASIYNDTTLILSINTTSNIVSLGFYNTTQVDAIVTGNATGGGGNSSWNESYADTLYYAIDNPSNFINITTGQSFNQTLMIQSVNTTANIQQLQNRTFLYLTGVDDNACNAGDFVTNVTFNNGILSIVCATPSNLGNASWNESYANTLYYDIDNPSNFLNITTGQGFNQTTLVQSVNTTANIQQLQNRSFSYLLGIDHNVCSSGQFVTNVTFLNGDINITCGTPTGIGDFFFANYTDSFNNNFSSKTTDDLTQGTTNRYDNRTWNETRADSLYYDIDNPSNFINHTFNTTYNNILGQNCPVGFVVNGTYSNGTFKCTQDQTTTMNFTNLALTNQSNTFTGNQTINGNLTASWIHAFINWSRVQNVPAFALASDVWTAISQNRTEIEAEIDSVNSSANIQQLQNRTFLYLTGIDDNVCPAGQFVNNVTFNNGLLTIVCDTPSGGNSSWNESYANTLYAGIEWDYNQTTAAINDINSRFWNRTQSYNRTEVDSIVLGNASAGDNSSWNESYANTLYYDIDNPSNFINITSGQGFNQTLMIQSVNTTANIQQLQNRTFLYLTGIDDNACSAGEFVNNVTFNNGVLTITCATASGNSSWNESYANTLYYDIDNPSNFINHTFNTTYNNILNQRCPAGQVVNGTLSNGTFICTTATGSTDYTNLALTNQSNFFNGNQTFNSSKVNITAPSGNTNFYLGDWLLQRTSTQFIIRSPNAADLVKLDNSAETATFINQRATPKFSGAIAFIASAVASQSADIFVVEDSSGNDYLRVNGTGNTFINEKAYLGANETSTLDFNGTCTIITGPTSQLELC